MYLVSMSFCTALSLNWLWSISWGKKALSAPFAGFWFLTDCVDFLFLKMWRLLMSALHCHGQLFFPQWHWPLTCYTITPFYLMLYAYLSDWCFFTDLERRIFGHAVQWLDNGEPYIALGRLLFECSQGTPRSASDASEREVCCIFLGHHLICTLLWTLLLYE